MEPLVYIILVNHRGYIDTVDCVKSLLNIKYKNYKIIIVENASSDEDILKKDEFLNAHSKILYASENKGFSDGNNIGIKYARQFKPEYILLLNNDTVVDKNFLNELVLTAKKYDKIGLVTGKIFYYNNSKELWYSGGTYNRDNGRTNQVLYGDLEEKEQIITFASGCLMLISRECIDKVGLLDDNYFMYSEDTDYCCRVYDAGLKIIWTPRSVIYHKVSASAGNNSIFQQYYITRNNFIITKKYGNNKCRAYCTRLFQCIKDVIKGRTTIKAVVWAYMDFIRGKLGISDRFK